MNPYVKDWRFSAGLPSLVGNAALASWNAHAGASGGAAAFELPELPYAKDALAPHISSKTLEFHHGKHHQAYVDKLNALAPKADMAGMPLEDIIRKTVGKEGKEGLFNNAAQVWNHTFFWECMKAGGGGSPSGNLSKMIDSSFGSLADFKTAFVEAAVGQFGSGWAWVIQDGSALKITTSSNACTPIAHKQTPILTCDVWEHAYYLDYQNRRKDFVETFLNHLVNWSFAAKQLK